MCLTCNAFWFLLRTGGCKCRDFPESWYDVLFLFFLAFLFSADMDERDEVESCSIYPVCCCSTLCMRFTFWKSYPVSRYSCLSWSDSLFFFFFLDMVREITQAPQTLCNACNALNYWVVLPSDRTFDIRWINGCFINAEAIFFLSFIHSFVFFIYFYFLIEILDIRGTLCQIWQDYWLKHNIVPINCKCAIAVKSALFVSPTHSTILLYIHITSLQRVTILHLHVCL